MIIRQKKVICVELVLLIILISILICIATFYRTSAVPLRVINYIQGQI